MRYFLCLFLFTASIRMEAEDTLQLVVPFFSQNIVLPYTTPSPTLAPEILQEETLVAWYYQLRDQWPHQLLLENIRAAKEVLVLNDWLYYELIRHTAQELVPGDLLHQSLLCWLLLSESGYDTRITYLDQQIFLYVYSEEAIFDTPMIENDSRRFVNLSSIHRPIDNLGSLLSMLTFNAMPYGRAFSFQLHSWPMLSPQPEKSAIAFSWQGQQFSFTLTIDATVAAFMKDYPLFEEHLYIEMPFSTTLSQSLLPELQKIIADKSKKETLEILAAFTRSAFAYKEDREHFGKNKPMIADEVFHYPFSDCEDRSALFYNLVRSLLDLPMLIIAYPNHLTIAVALDEAIGPSIRYDNRSYYICDPTGPANSWAIGRAPQGFEKVSFEILGQYK